MRNQIRKDILILSFFIFSIISVGTTQELPDTTSELFKKALRLFLDCRDCDIDYSRKQITFVNFVRDPSEAQVHIYSSSQRTAAGGKEFTLTFIGRENFIGLNDTLNYISRQSDTQEMIREGLVRTIKLGLMRYVAHTPIANQLAISHTTVSAQEKAIDKWDYWLFSLSSNFMFNGEKSYKQANTFWSLSANRVTQELKINLSYSGSYNDQWFNYGGDVYKSISHSHNFNGSFIFSITDHWSWGVFGRTSSSTYSNLDFDITFSPAIEYNIFPYSESTRRILRISYKPIFEYADYHEETIYNKIKEKLFSENLSLTLDQKEPWGSTSISLHASHYFNNIKKFNIGMFSALSIRVVEGFAIQLFGDYTIQRDQLSIAKSGASEEEVLLRRKELESQYNYWLSVGLSYSFGSIYNNIVNPRFGSGGGGYSFSFSSD